MPEYTCSLNCVTCPEYDPKLHLIVRLKRSGEYEAHLHCHYFQVHSD